MMLNSGDRLRLELNRSVSVCGGEIAKINKNGGFAWEMHERDCISEPTSI